MTRRRLLSTVALLANLSTGAGQQRPSYLATVAPGKSRNG
jgi:hypothetical protein